MAAGIQTLVRSVPCGHNGHRAILVGSRELKLRLGVHLRRVRQPRTFIITDRGVPAAELRPVDIGRGRDAIPETLEAHGAVIRPTRNRFAPFRPLRCRRQSIAAAISEGRGDRF